MQPSGRTRSRRWCRHSQLHAVPRPAFQDEPRAETQAGGQHRHVEGTNPGVARLGCVGVGTSTPAEVRGAFWYCATSTSTPASRRRRAATRAGDSCSLRKPRWCDSGARRTPAARWPVGQASWMAHSLHSTQRSSGSRDAATRCRRRQARFDALAAPVAPRLIDRVLVVVVVRIVLVLDAHDSPLQGVLGQMRPSGRPARRACSSRPCSRAEHAVAALGEVVDRLHGGQTQHARGPTQVAARALVRIDLVHGVRRGPFGQQTAAAPSVTKPATRHVRSMNCGACFVRSSRHLARSAGAAGENTWTPPPDGSAARIRPSNPPRGGSGAHRVEVLRADHGEQAAVGSNTFTGPPSSRM